MNLENRIVSSTPPDRLPRKGFSLFFVRLVDIKSALLTGKNDPLRNGYLKALLCKALKVPGFINPLPRKGTETRLSFVRTQELSGSSIHYPARGRKPSLQ